MHVTTKAATGISGSRIVAVGHYQPARVLSNDELSTLVDTSDQWIRQRAGIATRRIAAADETVADMASAAAANALARSGLDAADIDLIVVATATAPHRMPSTAARVAQQLGITGASIFDLNAACSGFTYVLATADHAIQAASSRNALVIGADRMSGFLDWTDRSTCIIFGDGAGAAVLTAAATAETAGVGPVVWGSAPEHGDAITLETDDPDGPRAIFRQDGPAVYRWTTTTLAPLARQACARAGLQPEDLAGVVTHQSNQRIIDVLVRKIGARRAIVARDVAESGNTSAASIPLALSKLIEKGELPAGSPVLLFGYGAGLTFAGQVIRCP